MDYQEQLQTAFSKVLACEQLLVEAEARLRESQIPLQAAVANAETDLTTAWLEVEQIMQAQGVYEDTIPGEIMDYRIGYTKPRDKVTCPDPEAVPDEYCKLERKPVLAEIKKYLETTNKLPNWVTLEKGPSKLGWRAIKKKGDRGYEVETKPAA